MPGPCSFEVSCLSLSISLSQILSRISNAPLPDTAPTYRQLPEMAASGAASVEAAADDDTLAAFFNPAPLDVPSLPVHVDKCWCVRVCVRECACRSLAYLCPPPAVNLDEP